MLSSDGCDWGSSTGGDDNSPNDIRGWASGAYDDDATFTCGLTGGCI